MNPITSISNLSGDLLIAVIAILLFVEETGIPIPFAPGDLLLVIAGIAIASDTVDPLPMVLAILAATIIGAMLGREVFSAVGRPALLKVADALRFRKTLDRATHLLERGGARAVFVGRLVPGLRINTTQVAGVSNVPRLTFAAGLVPSVLVYVAVFVGIGAIAGQPAVRLLNRAEHRLFVLVVSVLAGGSVILSIRWLARRGALAALEPIALGVRRDMADALEAALPWSAGDPIWREYPLVRRFWAGLIDGALAFAMTIFILTAAAGTGTAEVVFDPLGLALLLAVSIVYRSILEVRTGQTIGKTMMGISVYGPTGGVPRWWRAVLRNLVGGLVPLWPIDAVLVLRGRSRQRLGELLTSTVVRRVSR